MAAACFLISTPQPPTPSTSRAPQWSLWEVADGCHLPALFFLLVALWDQKFTCGGPESKMAVTSSFIDIAGDISFHTSQPFS